VQQTDNQDRVTQAAQHTPGPWFLDDPIHADLISDDYHFIGSGRGFFDTHGFGLAGIMSLSDARLIAAAPDLLGVLKRFPGFTDDATIGDAWVELMRAAIRLAETGERA
jgi:hypothetical protein